MSVGYLKKLPQKMTVKINPQTDFDNFVVSIIIPVDRLKFERKEIVFQEAVKNLEDFLLKNNKGQTKVIYR